MKKKFLNLLIVLMTIGIFIPTVKASSITEAGDEVIAEGNYDSIRLVAGKKVTNKSTIDGLSFAAANELILEGHVSYGIYAGNIITVNEQVDKDLFIAGNIITINSDSVIGRDLFTAGSKITIASNVTRNLYAAGDTVDISGITINGNASIDAEEIIMDEKTTITGKLSYVENSKVTGLDKATIGDIITKKSSEKIAVVEYSLKDQIYAFVVNTIAAFIVMAVLFYLLKDSQDRLLKTNLETMNIIKTIGVGLILLIVIPLSILIALFTGFLTPLAVITACIYGITLYLSKYLVAFIIGSLINKKLIKNDNTYVSLAIGIVLIKLAKLIPFLGAWINTLAILYGIGLTYKYITIRKTSTKN